LRERTRGGRAAPTEIYDAARYERWYRDPRTRLLGPAERRRRVAAVVAAAERWLERPLRSALDVGCGLGLWGRELRRLRPALAYVGYEPSSAVPRVLRRGFEIRRGSFDEVAALAQGDRFDLVLCVDVLHYLGAREVDAALAALAPRARGPLVLEVMTSADDVEGDVAGFRARRPGWWRERFARHGLAGVGLHLWLAGELAAAPAALERTAPIRSGRP
jgi:SAM-dependent methyltransferase